jgi:DNA (cytosine-5)-methyltransferase 1
MNGNFQFIDLFAGIGGVRIAFEAHKMKCVFSSEWDKFSQQTYAENHGDIPYGDITKIHENDIPNHDILTAGFPCQPFSTIGLRQGFNHETQGTLFFDIVRILKAKRPKAFLLENVSGLKTHNEGKTFEVIQKTLQNELDYKIYFNILDSADYGVPQHRRRIYIIGFANELTKDQNFNFQWPAKNKKVVGIGRHIEQHSTGYNISTHLQNSYIFKVDDGRPQIVDENSNFPVKTLVSTYHKIQRLTGTFVKDGSTGLRLLSENECKAVMGFPKNFIVPVSRTQMYRQFGNSVAVPVVQKIAKQIKASLIQVEANTIKIKKDKALV